MSKNDYVKKGKYSLGSIELYRENLYFMRQYPMWYQVLRKRDYDVLPGVDLEKIFTKEKKVISLTENQAIHNIELYGKIEENIGLVNRAFMTIPKPYRAAVFNHIMYKKSYMGKDFDYANIKTWKFWTQKVIFEVAIRRGQGKLIKALNENAEQFPTYIQKSWDLEKLKKLK